MRIAFLVTHFPVASETPFLNQVTGMLERGHDVRIYADAASRSSLEHPDVQRLDLRARTNWPVPARGFWQRFGVVLARWRRESPAGRRMLLRSLDPRWGRAARSLRLAHQVTRYLPGERFDVIQGCFGGDGLRAVRLRKIGAITGPVVTAFRGTDVTRFLRRRGPQGYAELFAHGELFLPVSQSLATELVAAGCPPERLRVHHTGIDLSQHPFRPRALPTDRPVRFVSLGRLVPKKGLADALAVIQALHAAGRMVEYHVVGDGPLQRALEAAASGLPPGVVRFHGALLPEEARELLDAMDVLLSPHRTAPDGDVEGIPNVLKEAMALGIPVVATRHGGIPELVEDGRSGFLAPEGDVAGLVAHCRRLLDDPAAWPALAAAGRAAVEAGFDISRLNDTLEELYRGLALREPAGERQAP